MKFFFLLHHEGNLFLRTSALPCPLSYFWCEQMQTSFLEMLLILNFLGSPVLSVEKFPTQTKRVAKLLHFRRSAFSKPASKISRKTQINDFIVVLGDTFGFHCEEKTRCYSSDESTLSKSFSENEVFDKL